MLESPLDRLKRVIAGAVALIVIAIIAREKEHDERVGFVFARTPRQHQRLGIVLRKLRRAFCIEVGRAQVSNAEFLPFDTHVDMQLCAVGRVDVTPLGRGLFLGTYRPAQNFDGARFGDRRGRFCVTRWLACTRGEHDRDCAKRKSFRRTLGGDKG